MLTLIAAILGALFGAFKARARGGKTPDMLQWAAVFAMLFGVIGMILSLVLLRLG